MPDTKRLASARKSTSSTAIHSVNCSAVSKLAVDRELDLLPGSVSTGTPCQSASSVVVAPENGIGSSAMSTSPIAAR